MPAYEAIASRLGIDFETFRDIHGPWLERAGLIERTERGRVATKLAWVFYGPAKRVKPENGNGRKPIPTIRGIPILPFKLHLRR